MTRPSPISAAGKALHEGCFKLVRVMVIALAAAAGAGIIAMMTVTCLDVVLRLFGRPLTGAMDIVNVAAVIAIAGALPYTTAVKGHVAIEYFFQKLSRRGRIVVDTAVRLLGMGLFGLLCWGSIRYGCSLRRTGEVTLTLQLPVFWLPWVIAASCATVVLVILYNLLHPGREFMKP